MFVNRLRVLLVFRMYYIESFLHIKVTQIERMDHVLCVLILLIFENVGYNILRFSAIYINKAFMHKPFRLMKHLFLGSRSLFTRELRVSPIQPYSRLQEFIGM